MSQTEHPESRQVPDSDELDSTELPCSRCAIDAISYASGNAQTRGSQYITTEDLLTGILTGDGSAARSAVIRGELDPDKVIDDLWFIAGTRSPSTGSVQTPPTPSPRLERVFDASQKNARRTGADRVETIHLLAGILQERHGLAAHVLKLPGVGLDSIANQVRQSIEEEIHDSE